MPYEARAFACTSFAPALYTALGPGHCPGDSTMLSPFLFLVFSFSLALLSPPFPPSPLPIPCLRYALALSVFYLSLFFFFSLSLSISLSLSPSLPAASLPVFLFAPAEASCITQRAAADHTIPRCRRPVLRHEGWVFFIACCCCREAKVGKQFIHRRGKVKPPSASVRPAREDGDWAMRRLNTGR